MAGRRRPTNAPTRKVKRLAAALEPPARGAVPRALSDTAVTAGGLGFGLILLLAAELHLHGAAAVAVRVLVVGVLGAGLGIAARRLRARVDMVVAVREGLDALGEAVVITDRATLEILHASPAAEGVYARQLDELVGIDARTLARPEDRAQIDERVRLRAAGHKVPTRSAMPLAAGPGGEPRYVEWSTVPLTLGRSELLLTVARDVTPHLAAERRLADEHAFLEAVLDAAAHPIVVLAPDGRLLRVNAAAARLAGAEPAAMVGRTPWALGLMTTEQAAEADTALRDGRDPFHHVVTWRAADGTERVVAWSATAMRGADGRIRSAVSIGRDLTGQRVAEDRARRAHAALDLRSHELERSNRDLAQFAALASHDLREPVLAVRGFGDLLEAHAGPALDPRSHSYLRALRESAEHAEELLDGLTAFGRLGRGDALAADVDCDRTLDTVLGDLAGEIAASAAVVTRDPLPVVPGDPEELALLFANLVANALRYGGASGPQVHVGAERRDLGWELTVSDDGDGVPECERQRIFQIFRRLHPRGRQRGSGVGLALCRRIVERHGGSIWVDDASGGGSAFHVTLPDREAR